MDKVMTQQVSEMINQRITSVLTSFNGAPVAIHTHNGYDAPILDPIVSLLGFPVYQVSDASTAPTDTYQNGKFRFLVGQILVLTYTSLSGTLHNGDTISSGTTNGIIKSFTGTTITVVNQTGAYGSSFTTSGGASGTITNSTITPNFYLWAYLVYLDASNTSISKWVGVQLS